MRQPGSGLIRLRKRDAKDRAVEAVNPLKSRLLDVYNDLMRADCVREAESLDKMIAKLESWQARLKEPSL